jgi:hypothetical protein
MLEKKVWRQGGYWLLLSCNIINTGGGGGGRGVTQQPSRYSLLPFYVVSNRIEGGLVHVVFVLHISSVSDPDPH